MNTAYLRNVAIQVGVPENNWGTSEKMLIRAIQKQRGDEPCFLSDKRYGCHEVCEWSASCQKLKAIWLR